MHQDPVKYPDNMSSTFQSFLKGLLNKVLFFWCSLIYMICLIDLDSDLILYFQMPQSRLTWPQLLEHPFVKETSSDTNVTVSVDIYC